MEAVATYQFPENDLIAASLKLNIAAESYDYLHTQKVIAAVSAHFELKSMTRAAIDLEMTDILSKMSLQMDDDSLAGLCQRIVNAIIPCATEILSPKRRTCCAIL